MTRRETIAARRRRVARERAAMTSGALTRSRIERYFYECRRDRIEPQVNGVFKAVYLPVRVDDVLRGSPLVRALSRLPAPAPIAYDVPSLAFTRSA